jgi:hypothetical protein
MKQFVLIFRQGQKPLTNDQRKQISAKMPAWVSLQFGPGRKLEPRILTLDPSWTVNGSGIARAPANERPVTALLFVETVDFQDAVRIAETHPGLAYDVSIEVREWTPPAPAPAAAR